MKSIEYDPHFIIRGLFYDMKRCIMMKLDSYSVIDDKAVFRGLERISEIELENIYETRRMGIHKTDKNFSRRPGRNFYQVRNFLILASKILYPNLELNSIIVCNKASFGDYLKFWPIYLGYIKEVVVETQKVFFILFFNSK